MKWVLQILWILAFGWVSWYAARVARLPYPETFVALGLAMGQFTSSWIVGPGRGVPS
jgi:TRAP-type C4-dicarboxylate transport system permease small subunit